jgi:hypothetical protein
MESAVTGGGVMARGGAAATIGAAVQVADASASKAAEYSEGWKCSEDAAARPEVLTRSAAASGGAALLPGSGGAESSGGGGGRRGPRRWRRTNSVLPVRGKWVDEWATSSLLSTAQAHILDHQSVRKLFK